MHFSPVLSAPVQTGVSIVSCLIADETMVKQNLGSGVEMHCLYLHRELKPDSELMQMVNRADIVKQFFSLADFKYL